MQDMSAVFWLSDASDNQKSAYFMVTLMYIVLCLCPICDCAISESWEKNENDRMTLLFFNPSDERSF